MEQAAFSSTIDEVLNKTNIVDVISKYIDVQKKGNNYVAVCPFHNDSSPSLSIAVDKKIFKCFPCGTGGNAIGFVQRFKSITFAEALHEVASMVGIDIKINKKNIKKYSNIQEKVISINEDAMHYFYSMLFTSNGKTAIDYLKKRNIGLSEIRKFEIGFSKSKYDLYDFLKNKRNYTDAEIEESKLFIKKGLSYIPYFYNRIIFPIKDFSGKIVGFSGRLFETDNGPKYLNTSENVIFKKSHIAFNFHDAESSIRTKDEILILEGYMDVISLNRAEIKNAVAIMGTSLSDYQIKEFAKFTSNFTLFLDGDEPGVQASLKIAKKLFSHEINLKIVFNNSNSDPDELVNKGDKNKVINMIKDAKSPEEFTLEYIKTKIKLDNSLNNIEKMSKILFDVLSYSNNSSKIENVINSFAKLVDLSKASIEKDFLKFKGKIKEPKIKKTNTSTQNNFIFENIDNNIENTFVFLNNDEFDDVSDFYSPPLVERKSEELKLNNKITNQTTNYFLSITNIINYFLETEKIKDDIKSSVALFRSDYIDLCLKIFEIRDKNPDFTKVDIINELKRQDDKKILKTFNEYKKLNLLILNSGNKEKKLNDSAKILEILNINNNIKEILTQISIYDKLRIEKMELLSKTSDDDKIINIRKEILEIENSIEKLRNEELNLINKRGKLNNGI